MHISLFFKPISDADIINQLPICSVDESGNVQQQPGVNCMPRLDEQLNDDMITTAINDELVPEPLDPFEDGNEVLPFCSSNDEDELDIRSEISETIVSENVNCRPRPPCLEDTVSQYLKQN